MNFVHPMLDEEGFPVPAITVPPKRNVRFFEMQSKRRDLVAGSSVTKLSFTISAKQQPTTPNNGHGASVSPSLEFLKQYFNFTYFLCLSPYKIEKSPDDFGSFAAKTSIWRKFLCGIIHIGVLYRYANYIRYSYSVPNKDATPYVTIVSLVTSALAYINKCTFLYSFWKYKKGFVNLFNEIDKHVQGGSRSGKSARNLAFSICAIYLLIAIIFWIKGRPFLLLHEWSLKQYIFQAAGFTKYMLMLTDYNIFNKSTSANQNNLLINGVAVNEDDFEVELKPLDYVLAALQIILLFYQHVLSFYSDLISLMSSLTFFYSTRQLMSHEQDQLTLTKGGGGFGEHIKVLANYSSLKRITDKLNGVVGPVLFACILEEVVYFASYIGDVTSSANWIPKIRYVIFVITFFSILFVAGRAASQVESLADWLFEGQNAEPISSVKLIALYNELSKHRVGLSPMGMFTITYGFIGTVVTFILTFAVIILQRK